MNLHVEHLGLVDIQQDLVYLIKNRKISSSGKVGFYSFPEYYLE